MACPLSSHLPRQSQGPLTPVTINGGYLGAQLSDWAVAEVLVFGRVLDAREVRRLEHQLMDRWVGRVGGWMGRVGVWAAGGLSRVHPGAAPRRESREDINRSPTRCRMALPKGVAKQWCNGRILLTAFCQRRPRPGGDVDGAARNETASASWLCLPCVVWCAPQVHSCQGARTECAGCAATSTFGPTWHQHRCVNAVPCSRHHGGQWGTAAVATWFYVTRKPDYRLRRACRF